MNDKIIVADKELKKTKRWISFMLFGIALGSGNLVLNLHGQVYHPLDAHARAC